MVRQIARMPHRPNVWRPPSGLFRRAAVQQAFGVHQRAPARAQTLLRARRIAGCLHGAAQCLDQRGLRSDQRSHAIFECFLPCFDDGGRPFLQACEPRRRGFAGLRQPLDVTEQLALQRRQQRLLLMSYRPIWSRRFRHAVHHFRSLPSVVLMLPHRSPVLSALLRVGALRHQARNCLLPVAACAQR